MATAHSDCASGMDLSTLRQEHVSGTFMWFANMFFHVGLLSVLSTGAVFLRLHQHCIAIRLFWLSLVRLLLYHIRDT
jgi:hypothetical protein